MLVLFCMIPSFAIRQSACSLMYGTAFSDHQATVASRSFSRVLHLYELEMTYKQRRDLFIMPESEIARFRQEQSLREQASKQGLYGIAVVASHAAITARMEREAERFLQLIREGKHDEVIALMGRPAWERTRPPEVYIDTEGRRHRGDAPYLLPKDEQELQRLSYQHFILRQVLKG